MKKYSIGDQVWHASYHPHHEEKVPCPVCYGNKTVIVILGNGDEVAVACEYCKSGYQGATGYVTEYVQEAVAQLVTITRVRTDTNNGEEEIEYIAVNQLLRPEQMFDTESEAFECASRLLNDHNRKQNANPKYKNEKSYTWNAGYHMRRAKDAQRDFEFHTERAKLCKSKSKEK